MFISGLKVRSKKACGLRLLEAVKAEVGTLTAAKASVVTSAGASVCSRRFRLRSSALALQFPFRVSGAWIKGSKCC